MRGDLSAIGLQGTRKRRVAAAATRYEVGEPLISTATLNGSGVASANTFVLAAQDFPTVGGDDTFGGIAISGAVPFASGTLVAHTARTACPVPHIGLLRGKAETSTNIDTAAELLAIINDAVLVDYAAAGAPDGGELYTIKDTASADTSGLAIVEGDIAKGTLDCEVYATMYRIDQDVT